MLINNLQSLNSPSRSWWGIKRKLTHSHTQPDLCLTAVYILKMLLCSDLKKGCSACLQQTWKLQQLILIASHTFNCSEHVCILIMNLLLSFNFSKYFGSTGWWWESNQWLLWQNPQSVEYKNRPVPQYFTRPWCCSVVCPVWWSKDRLWILW